MNFRETLDRHLQAIQQRDLAGLTETLADRDLTLITADGRLMRSTADFVAMHQHWFAMQDWTLGVSVKQVEETADMGLAVLQWDYRETPADRPPLRQCSLLTLVFRRQGERWVMVLDQNTPGKPAA